MSEIIITDRQDTEHVSLFRVAAVDENGTQLSKGSFRYVNSNFGKTQVKALLAGGIATPVHYRRGGNVRKMFDVMFDTAIKDGVAVALLHPFSFSYYRKFGYEKVCDHVIVRCSTRMLDFVPRRCTLVPYDESKLSDLIKVYAAFSKGRNVLLQRTDDKYYKDPKKQIYVYYEKGVAAGYIVYSAKNELIVNHLGNGLLTVHELCYTTPQALREIFSFLRMFEGEYDEIEFANIAPCVEVELMLKHYTHTSYTVVPDIMAKTLNAEKLLLTGAYPQKEGGFTVKIEDSLPSVAGTFKVAYGGGDCLVKRTDKTPDLTLAAPAFTRLVYGYDGIDAERAKYMDGVQIDGNAQEFFLAFSKKPCGVFEHF